MRKKKLLSLVLVIGLMLQCVPVIAVDSLNNIEKVVTADSRSFFISIDDKVYVSGSNSNGMAGLGDLVLKTNKAVEIPFIDNVRDIAATTNETYFIRNDGSVYVVGNGKKLPVKVDELSGVKKITTDGNSLIALKNDGTVYIKGDNKQGQLGAGTTTTVSKFTKLSGVSNVKDVQMGNEFATFLFEDGTVKATGKDENGRLGLGNDNYKTIIVRTLSNVNVPTGVSKIAVGDSQIMYLGVDGKLYTSGGVGSYLGVGTSNSKGITTPTLVSIFNGKTIKDIKSAEGSYVLLSDNTLWTVGLNSYGQSLTGDTNSYTSYRQVASGVSEVFVGSYQTFIKTTTNELKGAGKNSNGELSIGSMSGVVLLPTKVIKGSLIKEEEVIKEPDNSVIKEGKIYFRHAALVDNKINMSGSGDINGNAAINNGTVNLAWTTFIKGDLLLGEGVSKTLYRDTAVTGSVKVLNPKLIMPIVNEPIQIPSTPSLPSKGSIITNWDNASSLIKESGAYETISIVSGYTVVIDTEGRDIHLSVENLNIGQGFIDIRGGGTVYLYLNEPMNISQGSKVNDSGQPNQLNIYVKNSGGFNISGSGLLKGNVYAPNSTLSVGGGGKLVGKVYVGGNSVSLSGNAPLIGDLYGPNAKATLSGSSGIRGNIIVGGTTVDLSGTTTMTGGVYAPRADVTITGSSGITGALIAKSVSISGGSYINYEELTIDVPGYVAPEVPEEPEVPVIPEEPETPETPEEPIVNPIDLDFEFIINVSTDGEKKIGAAISAYGDMLEHVDNSNRNLSLKRVKQIIEKVGSDYVKTLQYGVYNLNRE